MNATTLTVWTVIILFLAICIGIIIWVIIDSRSSDTNLNSDIKTVWGLTITS